VPEKIMLADNSMLKAPAMAAPVILANGQPLGPMADHHLCEQRHRAFFPLDCFSRDDRKEPLAHDHGPKFKLATEMLDQSRFLDSQSDRDLGMPHFHCDALHDLFPLFGCWLELQLRHVASWGRVREKRLPSADKFGLRLRLSISTGRSASSTKIAVASLEYCSIKKILRMRPTAVRDPKPHSLFDHPLAGFMHRVSAAASPLARAFGSAGARTRHTGQLSQVGDTAPKAQHRYGFAQGGVLYAAPCGALTGTAQTENCRIFGGFEGRCLHPR
jgi:hypothetical protein